MSKPYFSFERKLNNSIYAANYVFNKISELSLKPSDVSVSSGNIVWSFDNAYISVFIPGDASGVFICRYGKIVDGERCDSSTMRLGRDDVEENDLQDYQIKVNAISFVNQAFEFIATASIVEPNQCPFCGGNASVYEGHRSYVYCSKSSCRTFGPSLASVSEAIAAWNSIKLD